MITSSQITTYYKITDSGSDAIIAQLIADAYVQIQGILGVDLSASGVITEKRVKELSENKMFLSFEPATLTSVVRESVDITADIELSGRVLLFDDEEETTAYSGDKDLLEYVITYTPATRILSMIDVIAKEWVLYYLQRSPYQKSGMFEKSVNTGNNISTSSMTEPEFRRHFIDRLNELVKGI